MGTSIKSRDRQRRHRQTKRQMIEFYRATHPCVVCGTTDTAVLQFHHMDPSQKAFEVGGGISTYGIERLREEIAKCVMLCANDHLRVHAGLIRLEDYLG